MVQCKGHRGCPRVCMRVPSIIVCYNMATEGEEEFLDTRDWAREVEELERNLEDGRKKFDEKIDEEEIR